MQHVGNRVRINVEADVACGYVVDACGNLVAVEQLPFAHLSQCRAAVLSDDEAVEVVFVAVVEAVELSVLACVEAQSAACVERGPCSSVLRTLQLPTLRVAGRVVVSRCYAVHVGLLRCSCLIFYPRVAEVVEEELGVGRTIIQLVEVLVGVVVVYFRSHCSAVTCDVVVRQTYSVYLYVTYNDCISGFVGSLREVYTYALVAVAVGYVRVLERALRVESCVGYG